MGRTKNGVELPVPCYWAEPITLEQFQTFAPEKLELY